MTTFLNILSRSRKRKILRNILLIIPGVAGDFLIHLLIKDDYLSRLLVKLDMVYLIVTGLLICNSLLSAFMEVYGKSEKSRNHPLKVFIQALQVILMFVGGIIITATLIDKSPTTLLTGLGASAAILMLIFKDSILGFVAGMQLTQNNMIRTGDWIQMPDGSANGTVEEISLNTVKVRNWDNTITTIPPYTLISSTFRNWRGMMESGGRRVDKMIHLDMNTLKTCTADDCEEICKALPVMSDIVKENKTFTNSQLYRLYIIRYLKGHPVVAQDLDIIVAQREAGQFGLPVEVYFFLTDKVWDEFENIQSDIFDHLLAITSAFGLKLYQLPVQK